jgi:hypothetical protein
LVQRRGVPRCPSAEPLTLRSTRSWRQARSQVAWCRAEPGSPQLTTLKGREGGKAHGQPAESRFLIIGRSHLGRPVLAETLPAELLERLVLYGALTTLDSAEPVGVALALQARWIRKLSTRSSRTSGRGLARSPRSRSTTGSSAAGAETHGYERDRARTELWRPRDEPECRGDRLAGMTTHATMKRLPPSIRPIIGISWTMALAHTSVLSPDAGRLASGVSKGPLVREIHRLPVPQGRPTSVPSPASCVIRGGTAGSPRECGGPSNRGPRVMPTLMPIGSQNQSVGVGPLGRSVFRRRSQTGPVRLRTLSGNAEYRVKRYRGCESL